VVSTMRVCLLLAVLCGVMIPTTGLCAGVGSLPIDLHPNNVFGLDDVCAPQLGTSYPDFVFCAGSGNGPWPYVVFGGSYNQLAWADWENSVKYYAVQVDDFSWWTGVWVASWGDVNNDGDNDVLIGDPNRNDKGGS